MHTRKGHKTYPDTKHCLHDDFTSEENIWVTVKST